MTLATATAEGYAVGATITTANTSSGTPFDNITLGGTATLTAGTGLKGNAAYLFTPGSAQASAYWLTTLSTRCVFRFYVSFSGYPSSNLNFARIVTADGATTLGSLTLSPTGALLIAAASGTTKWTSVGALSLNTVYRVEGAVQQGTTTTGTFALSVFSGDSMTALTDVSTNVTNSNFGVTNQQIGRFMFGSASNVTPPTVAPFSFDDVGYLEGTTTLLGPTGAPTQQTLAPSSDVNKLNWTLTGGNGTNLYTCLNETIQDNTTYGATIGNPVGQVGEVGYPAFPLPGSMGGWNFDYVVNIIGATTNTIVSTILQSGTVISTLTKTNVNGGVSLFTHTLTAVEAATVTSSGGTVSNMRHRLTVTAAP